MTNTFERRREVVTLYVGDDEARLRDLADDIEKAQKREKDALPRTLDEASALVEAQAAYDEFKPVADSRAVRVTVQALGRRQWRSLIKEHPARKDNQADQAIGVNLETFPDVLVPISILEPKFDTPADRDDFLDELSDAQYDNLFYAAFGANRGTFTAPKVKTASPSSSATGE